MKALKTFTMTLVVALAVTACGPMVGPGFHNQDMSSTRCNRNGTRCVYRNSSNSHETLGTAEKIGIGLGVAGIGLAVLGTVAEVIRGPQPITVQQPGVSQTPVYNMNPCQLTDPGLQAECLRGLREGARARYEETKGNVYQDGYSAGYNGGW